MWKKFSFKISSLFDARTKSINQRQSQYKLNIDSTPRIYAALARHEYVACAPIKINASICADSAIGALMHRSLCVNAHGDEDKYLYWRVKTLSRAIAIRRLLVCDDSGVAVGEITLFSLPLAISGILCCIRLSFLFLFLASDAARVSSQESYSNVNQCHLTKVEYSDVSRWSTFFSPPPESLFAKDKSHVSSCRTVMYILFNSCRWFRWRCIAIVKLSQV